MTSDNISVGPKLERRLHQLLLLVVRPPVEYGLQEPLDALPSDCQRRIRDRGPAAGVEDLEALEQLRLAQVVGALDRAVELGRLVVGDDGVEQEVAGALRGAEGLGGGCVRHGRRRGGVGGFRAHALVRRPEGVGDARVHDGGGGGERTWWRLGVPHGREGGLDLRGDGGGHRDGDGSSGGRVIGCVSGVGARHSVEGRRVDKMRRCDASDEGRIRVGVAGVFRPSVEKEGHKEWFG